MFPYQPETVHPTYKGSAAVGSVRNRMARGDHAVRVFQPEPFDWDDTANPSEEMKLDVLTIRRAYGLAPFVGRPFFYMWDVAVDNRGRWIAGPTRIEYIEEVE